MLYLTVKSLHVIFVITWMAGLLYLMRLFVYHVQETESVVKERFKMMQRKLYKIITVPGMVLSLVFGLWMMGLVPQLGAQKWMWVKLTAVLVMIFMTFYSGMMIKQLANDQKPMSSKALRFLNEVPTLLMILIVFMVIMKPFV